MPQRSSYRKDYNIYRDGNTVRVLDPEERERRLRVYSDRKKAREREKNRINSQRDQQRAITMNRWMVGFFLICVTIVAVCSVRMIALQSSITTNQRAVARLESNLSDKKAENDARYKEITASVDLDTIRTRAMEELGMHYPTQDQICYYSVDKSNYIEQYSGIAQ